MELLLPIYPKDTILITPTIGVFEQDDFVFYLQSGLPIYTHPKESLDSFRFFTAKLVTMGRCRQTDIVRAFGVSSDSVARSVKLYIEKGESGFFGSDGRKGKAHKMLPERKARIQKMLDKKLSVNSIAKKEKISEGTIRYWIQKGELKKKTININDTDCSSTRNERDEVDLMCSPGMGFATTRIEDRVLAATGNLTEAPSIFEPHEAVRHGGLLTIIPALISQGLLTAKNIYKSWNKGYYGLVHILLTLCFIYLLRLKNPERLKSSSVGELGRIIGLDRVPEVKRLRKRIYDIVQQGQAAKWQNLLSTKWISNNECLYFYIDGHVRVYHGKKARLSKKHLARLKLCLAGTTEYWINDEKGLPLMCIIGELNERLKQAIEEVTPILIEQTRSLVSEDELNKNPLLPRFTLIFDREAYEPKFFHHLWEKYRVAVITYRKNVKDKWDEKDFYDVDYQLFNNNVSMHICEKEVILSECRFREIRKLADSGHQTSIITTNYMIKTEEIAIRMFSRWTQENYFKYIIAEFDFDKIIEYGSEVITRDIKIVNPEYSMLTQQIKKAREKKRRIEAKLYEFISKTIDEELDKINSVIQKQAVLQEKIDIFDKKIKNLLDKRSQVPSRIQLSDMPEDKRYNKLKKESKLFINIIKMIAYRAETALVNFIAPYYKNVEKDGRMLIKELLQTDADILPDYENNTLTIKIHSLVTPRANKAIESLCVLLNETKTIFPNTNLKMVFKTTSDNQKNVIFA